MIKPTVGRQVWYSPFLGDLHHVDTAQPCAATIVYVHSDRLVNLQVLDHEGNAYKRTSVTLLQEGDAPNPKGGDCMWMPYQKAVASGAQAPNLHPTVTLPLIVNAPLINDTAGSAFDSKL